MQGWQEELVRREAEKHANQGKQIYLRSYVSEVENLIQQGQIQEAIAHCRQILNSYPKHVDTYRLMGKAYLKSQRYGDASKIFQRVLSAIPDDFVSHVGMSIIREDEGNLDASIWHMERAFELQPYNSAIQNELRRLYGRRDGMEPPKVRLTQGALARMYAKGNLFQQAIAELRSAISDDPQRPDLLVVLARVHADNSQTLEAVQISKKLLAKLPYCMEANRILAETLSETGQLEEALAHRQLIQDLDPYEAHVSPNAAIASEVPDQAVTLERLEWEPGMTTTEVSAQLDWKTSLGITLDEETDNKTLPDRLSTILEEPSEDCNNI
jgi:tetratricopeptide (TPR) repeat protein